MPKGTVDYDTALLRYSTMRRKTIATPFIRLKSLSADEVFCLWIKKTEVAEPLGTTFSSYGLNAVASDPNFDPSFCRYLKKYKKQLVV
jgi:CRISPR-associated endonuclease Csy4